MKFLFDDESFSFETLRTAGFAITSARGSGPPLSPDSWLAAASGATNTRAGRPGRRV
jgi:hypothetical protein